ncbi:hypothetical protein B0A49_07446 [Cryomyces minteri]|uniref:AB hydrolase-1 domain-containing protein n=1 Tax=Cryomyces minteri TaxID=331657 RepID=A0A4U0XEJ7_9PEZI|nr:hypothetical protein B0A49_07446 [Cryomyces minteri]
MPLLQLPNNITINYRLEGEGPETVVLVNGLADDLVTWAAQVPALLKAGFRTGIMDKMFSRFFPASDPKKGKAACFDNRGIGASSSPPGPYSAIMLATDVRALILSLNVTRYHLLGVSMGGMIAQAYVLQYAAGKQRTAPPPLSVTLACTYAAPGPFCTRMFALWADMARAMGVPAVMRDVTLWAFTLDFFRTPERAAELREVETAMEGLDMSLDAYLAQLAVIQDFDTTAVFEGLKKDVWAVPTLVLAGEEDVLIPTKLSEELARMIEEAEWRTVRGGHGCMWEFPDAFNEAVVTFLKRHSQ